MNAIAKSALRIELTHPALAGHFPGNPVVPGVVLLQRVASAWQVARGARIGKLDAKFMQPLLPEQDATIELHEDGAHARFSIVRADGTVLARGTLEPVAGIVSP
ncbi:MAG: hydroxymyristoyl-ACP dehydratase [Rhodanobacteraceae bacterium]